MAPSFSVNQTDCSQSELGHAEQNSIASSGPDPTNSSLPAIRDNLALAGTSDSLDKQVSYPQLQERKIRFGTSFVLTVEQSTQAFFRLRPTTFISVSDQFLIGSGAGTMQQTSDPDLDLAAAGGRSCQLMDRIVLKSGATQIRYSGEMTIEGSVDVMPTEAEAPRLVDLTPENWLWLQPSRYCRPDELGEEAWSRFGQDISAKRPATGATVRGICTYVNESMEFAYGTTTSGTSATESWSAKRGVCRDYNHIAISFCRALNIPARYAFGYLPDIDVEPSSAPMDFCAWFEVFLERKWWTFDARVNEPRIGRVVVGRGRDAADVPMISTLGPALLSEFGVHASEVACFST